LRKWLRSAQSHNLGGPAAFFKMGEDWILKQVRSCNADGYLVRNYDHLNTLLTAVA